MPNICFLPTYEKCDLVLYICGEISLYLNWYLQLMPVIYFRHNPPPLAALCCESYDPVSSEAAVHSCKLRRGRQPFSGWIQWEALGTLSILFGTQKIVHYKFRASWCEFAWAFCGKKKKNPVTHTAAAGFSRLPLAAFFFSFLLIFIRIRESTAFSAEWNPLDFPFCFSLDFPVTKYTARTVTKDGARQLRTTTIHSCAANKITSSWH